MCFKSILISHDIICDTVVKKAPLPPLTPFERAGGIMPPLSGIPPCRYCDICGRMTQLRLSTAKFLQIPTQTAPAYMKTILKWKCIVKFSVPYSSFAGNVVQLAVVY